MSLILWKYANKTLWLDVNGSQKEKLHGFHKLLRKMVWCGYYSDCPCPYSHGRDVCKQYRRQLLVPRPGQLKLIQNAPDLLVERPTRWLKESHTQQFCSASWSFVRRFSLSLPGITRTRNYSELALAFLNRFGTYFRRTNFRRMRWNNGLRLARTRPEPVYQYLLSFRYSPKRYC